MVVMFSLNQAALPFIQLLVMCQIFAETVDRDHRNTLVSWRDSVLLTCNISVMNATQISWNNSRYVWTHSFTFNQTFWNFIDRVTIDLDFPSTLHISNAQHDDAGLYQCTVSGRKGLKTIEWNLTVSEKPEELPSPWYFPYILTSVIGLLLCSIIAAVCIYRKLSARRANQNPVQDQFHLDSGEVVVVRQRQGGSGRRTDNKHSSQYIERLNSIYGVN